MFVVYRQAVRPVVLGPDVPPIPFVYYSIHQLWLLKLLELKLLELSLVDALLEECEDQLELLLLLEECEDQLELLTMLVELLLWLLLEPLEKLLEDLLDVLELLRLVDALDPLDGDELELLALLELWLLALLELGLLELELGELLSLLDELELRSSIDRIWSRFTWSDAGPGNCREPVWKFKTSGTLTSPLVRVSVNTACQMMLSGSSTVTFSVAPARFVLY